MPGGPWNRVNGGVPFTGSVYELTGAEAESHCLNWSSSAAGEEGWRGYASTDSNDDWIDQSAISCNQNGRLYCFSNVVTLSQDGFDLSEDLSRWPSSVSWSTAGAGRAGARSFISAPGFVTKVRVRPSPFSVPRAVRR